MNQFVLYDLILVFNRLETWECTFATAKSQGHGGALVSQEHLTEAIDVISAFQLFAELGDLAYLKDGCVQAKFQLERQTDYSSAQTTLNGFKISFVAGLRKIKLLRIHQDRAEYLDGMLLFGREVASAFPSAQRDITEAGNCLAVECSTAAVFHLMRASEFGLRALARDRDVEFKDKPLEDRQWGEILNALQTKLNALRNADRKNWPSIEARDPQIIFYNEVVQELRGFNDAWRKHLSHADVLAFYERDNALGILKHVRTFMQKLASRISETSITPEYWTTP